MQKKTCFEIIIFLFFTKIKSDAYKNEDVNSPAYFLKSDRLPLMDKNYFILLPNNNITGTSKASPGSSIIQSRKRHTNKAKQKQYEKVNMLWRKTKIFIDIASYTRSYRPKKIDDPRTATINFNQHRNPFQFPNQTHTSTPSYIEFYYLHEVDDCVQNNSVLNINIYSENKVPKIILHQNENRSVIQNKNTSISSDPANLKTYKLSVNNNSINSTDSIIVNNTLSTNNKLNKKINIPSRDFVDSKNYTNIDGLNINKKEYNIKSTTLYDKIKFFEIYDNQTQIPIVQKILQDLKNSSNSNNQGKYILLEYLRNDIGHVDNKTRHYVKKHIVENRNEVNARNTKSSIDNSNPTRTTALFDVCLENKECSDSLKKSLQVRHESNTSKTFFHYINKSTLWTEYPFVAVYIYKPLQVHCDAAGISTHWLIASAACLSRNYGNLVGGGQSAFVTYCGNSWWLPERVAYVKYTLIHPRYHPHDRIRRQLYNIGVIQIVSSMASACPSWSPVPLMSHQFTANTDVSKATAIGWGLDRYDTRYTSTELPKRPLASYESLVHSGSCPGSFRYSKGTNVDSDVASKNLYCLSLPPYNGEENDPIHGSILLVEEKLIALYLQEERRPWGEQSAQYTGTWRLIPWIFEVAQEVDETDFYN